MKKIENNGIILNKDDYFDKEDLLNLNRLQKVLIEEENIYATIEECVNMWGRYSNDLCASWLLFPENDKDFLRHIKTSDFFTTYEDYLIN